MASIDDQDAPESDLPEPSNDAGPRRSGRAHKAAFSKRLGQLVHGRGIRQADLARKTELAPHLISTYMLGKAIPGKVNLIKLAKALNVAPENLLPEPSGEEDTYTNSSPMALVVNPGDPSTATLRVNMQVKTALGSEIIQMLLKGREAQA